MGKLENITFEGKINEINKISFDLNELIIEIKGNININCFDKLKKVLIKPNDEKGYEIKFSDKSFSNLSSGSSITKFDYNERTYYLSSDEKTLTSQDKLFERILCEETAFYKTKK